MSRSFEIIGEAAKHIPDSFRLVYSEIEWKGMTGFRDKLIHGYFSIDIVYLWEVAEQMVPVLQTQIRCLLENESNFR